ncbi:MAG: DUF4838 domain-containing protein [Clostridiales bacterium]|nr:DUF4838 domain-containing protein [Clostridiales bacterium]
MKWIKKSMAILLMASVLTGVFGCKSDSEESTEEIPETDSTKQENVLPTDEYLLLQGQSNYKIVHPKNAHEKELFAASELRDLFREATNVQLSIVSDEEVVETDKYISIGKTKFVQDKDFLPSAKEYGTSGYVINTEGSNVFIVGGGTTGTIYGTYKFLDYILGYDYFYPEIYALEKGTTNIPLMDYDVSIIPDLEYNSMRYGTNATYTQHYKYSMQRLPTTAINGETGHSAVRGWFPKSVYLNENDMANYHPNWYMLPGADDTDRVFDGTNVSQLCFTARGNETEYAAMVETAAKTMQTKMMEDSEAFMFDFSMTDDWNWCNCDACRSVQEKYGKESALVIHFLNDMTETVETWMGTEEGKPYEREFYVNFYAYFMLVDAPVKNNNGELSVVDDSVKCNKHVIPQLADIEMDYTQSIHDEINADSKQRYEEWSYVSERMSGYIYSARYNDYLSPLDTFNDMQALYQFSEEMGLMYIYNLGTGGADQEKGFPTGWCALRIYLAAKLGIDTSMDMNAAIDKFFKGVYLDAAEPMRKIFNEWRFTEEYNSKTYPEYVGKNSYYRDVKQEKYYSQSLLERWKGYFDEALEAIEYLKTSDPARYARTRDMIVGERVYVNYYYYSIYKLYLPTEKLSAVKKELADDIEHLGITIMVESPQKTVEGLLAELRG